MAVTLKTTIIWDVTPSSLVEIYILEEYAASFLRAQE
jgi:hypothetical protein